MKMLEKTVAEPERGACTAFARKGFTLIEVMIVVAVIAILGAIAVPNVAKYRIDSHAVLCVSNLQQIQLAKEHWMMVNASIPEMTDIAGGADKYIKVVPVCPASGKYAIGEDGVEPSCSVGMRFDKTGSNKAVWHSLSATDS